MSKLLDDDLLSEIINYIKVGNYVGTACAAAGVSEGTYYRWLHMGAAVEEKVSEQKNEDDLRARMEEGELILGFTVAEVRAWNFRREVLKATAIGEAYAVAMVRTQMPNQWTAAMTFLERRFPGRWKRREQIDVGETEVATGIDESVLLSDPAATKLIHDALNLAAQGALPPPDAVVVEGDDDEKGPPAP